MLQIELKNAKNHVFNLKAALAVVGAFAALPAMAVDTFPSIGVNANYAVVSLGAGSSLKINSGPIVGNVLAGQGSDVSSSGGNNGGVTGGFFIDNTVTGGLLAGLDTPKSPTTVSTALTTQALADALAAKAAASALTANNSFSSSITGNGGLNVISVADVNNVDFTLTGTANDFFVFNVSGAVHTNKVMTLAGVLPQNILWNLTGTGTVFQTSGGDKLYGTFLTTTGRYQFSNLDLTGRLINVGDHIEFVSGSSMTQAVPEPASVLMFVLGLAGLGVAKRKSLFAAR